MVHRRHMYSRFYSPSYFIAVRHFDWRLWMLPFRFVESARIEVFIPENGDGRPPNVSS